jgi:hypothetical protein
LGKRPPVFLLHNLLLLLLQLRAELVSPVLSLLPGILQRLQLACLVAVLINPAPAGTGNKRSKEGHIGHAVLVDPIGTPCCTQHPLTVCPLLKTAQHFCRDVYLLLQILCLLMSTCQLLQSISVLLLQLLVLVL